MTKEAGADGREVQTGFTLVEILVAIAVFGLIALVVFPVYRGTFRIIDQTQSEEDIYQMARIALERISSDLSSVCKLEGTQGKKPEETPAGPILFRGEKKDLGDLRCEDLRFFSLAHLDFTDKKSVAEPAEITYYGVARSDRKAFDLYRSDTLLVRERPESGAGGLVLCKGLSSIQFIYYDSQGEAHEEWDSGAGSFKGMLPARVVVEMEFPNPSNPDKPFQFRTGVAVPMAG